MEDIILEVEGGLLDLSQLADLCAASEAVYHDFVGGDKACGNAHSQTQVSLRTHVMWECPSIDGSQALLCRLVCEAWVSDRAYEGQRRASWA